MSGTAAAALGLTQASGAINSSPGGQHPTAAAVHEQHGSEREQPVRFVSEQRDADCERDPEYWAIWRLGLSRLTVFITSSVECYHPAGRIERTDDRSGGHIQRSPERARRRRRRRGLIYRSPGRPLLRRKSSTLPALTVWRARARRLSRSPDIMSRRRAPAARRRTILAITRRTRAQPRSSWRWRQPYRAQSRGSLLRLGSLTRRFLPSRSPIQTSSLQTVFRSSSRAEAAHWPTAQASVGSRKARPAFTSFRGPRPRSPANSTRLFLLRTRSPRRRHLL